MSGGVTNTSKRKQSLEDQYWDARVENACRIRDELVRKWAATPPPLKLPKGHSKTRSTFAHASRNKIVDKWVPVDFSSDEINYLPIGVPTLYDRQPVLTIKHILEYLVIKRESKREFLVARGFTKCCREDAQCGAKRCAKCWVLEQKQVKGVKYVVREVIDGSGKAKVVDPYGVHPKGKRAVGKDLDPTTRARFRLTSTQQAYKYKNSAWEE